LIMQKLSINLPHNPGVYLMRDYANQILYVGKAKDLQKRVSTYFGRHHDSQKTAALVSNIRLVDYIITESEKNALLLENKLIKKFKPKYNIMWRDDKTYPFICVTLNEDFPKLIISRKGKMYKARCYGPYHNLGNTAKLLKYLTFTFNLRPCKSVILENSAKNAKYGNCIYYQLKKCTAPCLNKITKTDYMKNVRKAQLFLQGKYPQLIAVLKIEMADLSKKMQYEKAAQLRDNIKTLEGMFDRIRFREIKEPELAQKMETARTLSNLKNYLFLKTVPVEIECIDISNIQGQQAVGSVVRFNNGLPDKSNYRRFKIKTVSAIDDYAMMREVVQRRYSRLIKENRKLPDLVMIDGGKGHLDTAKKTLTSLNLKTLPVISLAKKDELIFTTDKSEPLALTKDNPALQLLQHIRDEAHRFAITYHRLVRKKAFKGSLAQK